MEQEDLDKIKSFVITLLGLIAISGTILLVDKYLEGTLIWWVVMTIACVGYLYMRIHRDLYWSPRDVGKGPTNHYTGPATTLIEPESERRFELGDVVKIEIETTGDGPFDEDLYWIFRLNNAQPVRMAGPVAQGQGIFEHLQGFGGADFEATIQAASTVDPAYFLIWERDSRE